ncbi:MAG: sulfotransferase [Anaerolineales bacterium]
MLKDLLKLSWKYSGLILNRTLAPIELMLLAPNSAASAPSVWIIGPPRSGTTLLLQVLVRRYKFVYFSNFTAKLYGAPIIGIRLSDALKYTKEQSREFVSRYGRTELLGDPHEAGEFWYRWFPRGEHVYVEPNSMAQDQLIRFRREIIGMSKTANAPALFKNTYNTMRIAPIAEALPEAVFLVCERELVDTAQSILQGRIRNNGNKADWWSLPPKEIDQIRSHPYWQQVVEQVYYTYRQVDEDKKRFGEERFMSVSYHQLCMDTRGTLQSIYDFLKRRGINLQFRSEVPGQFPFSTGRKVSEDDYALIQQRVHELWKS